MGMEVNFMTHMFHKILDLLGHVWAWENLLLFLCWIWKTWELSLCLSFLPSLSSATASYLPIQNIKIQGPRWSFHYGIIKKISHICSLLSFLKEMAQLGKQHSTQSGPLSTNFPRLLFSAARFRNGVSCRTATRPPDPASRLSATEGTECFVCT